MNIIDSRLINLNSADAEQLNGQKLSKVIFHFSNILKEDNDNLFSTCGLLNAQIPFSFYNINVNNQVLYYSVNGTYYTMTITEGNYNSTTFITAFQTGFSSGGHGKTLTISISKLTGRLTFTLSTTYTLIFYYSTTTMFKVLGFNTSTDYSFTSSLEATYPCNLLGVKKIKIISSALANSSFDSSSLGNTNLLQTITVNDALFGVVTYQNQFDSYGRLKNQIINNIDLELRDEDNNLIDFNGIDWGICLQLNTYKRVNFTDKVLKLDSIDIPIIPENPPPQKNQSLGDENLGDEDLNVLLYQ